MNKTINILQKPYAIWLTGLPASGKTTLALGLHNLLNEQGVKSVVVDGDEFRNSFCADLGFSLNHRLENIRRAAEMAKLIVKSDVLAICSFVSPTNAIRSLASGIIGADFFIEVYLSTPLSVCQQRDPKGLYLKASQGLLPDFTGVSSPFEAPKCPSIAIDTSMGDPIEHVNMLYQHLTGCRSNS